MGELIAEMNMAKDIAPKLMMTVKLTGVKTWQVRVWIAIRLIKLAARIMNVGVKIEDIEWS